MGAANPEAGWSARLMTSANRFGFQVKRQILPIPQGSERFFASDREFFESNTAMNKRQLIDEIRRLNTTVPPQFLAQFEEPALKQYLEHLEGARKKHARIASWVRKTPKLRMVS